MREDLRKSNLKYGGELSIMKRHALFCIIFFLLAAVHITSLGENCPLNASGTANLPLNVNPAGKTEGYSAIVYNNPNGLPTSEANAIAETSEGFIWIGSYAGLIRYDGNTFERFDSTTGIASVRCLYADSLDRLWIGTNDSGLFLMEKGSLRHWDRTEGLRASSVRAVAETPDGTGAVPSVEGWRVSFPPGMSILAPRGPRMSIPTRPATLSPTLPET